MDRDAADQRAKCRYERIFAEIEAAERAEYDYQFSREFRAKYPFKPDGARAHRKVQARIAQEDADI